MQFLQKLFLAIFAPFIVSFKKDPITTIKTTADVMSDFVNKVVQLEQVAGVHSDIVSRQQDAISKAEVVKKAALDEVALAQQTQAAFKSLLGNKVS